MKCLLVIVLVLLLLNSGVSFSQETLTPLEQYQRSQEHALAIDKRFNARQTVLLSNNEETLVHAYEDLLQFSQSGEQKSDALSALETAIGRANLDSDAYKQGILTKGKLLKRLGRDDESQALFDDAIQNKWQHAMWRYSESLIDAGELDKACQLEYERVIGKGDYAHFRADKEDFFIFITLLRLMKSDKPEAKAMEMVFLKLEDSPLNPQAKKIAEALCLVQDEQYDEAVSILKQVDYELAKYKEENRNNVVDEYRNTPLYLTSALLFQGESLDVAHESYNEFLKRNDGYWKHIYDRSMRVVRDLEINIKQDLPKAKIITKTLLQSDIINNEEVKNHFTIDEIASLYDMHMQSIAWEGKFVEAAQLCKFVMDNYYPHTLAGANCAMNYARYVKSLDGNIDEAEGILLGILRDVSYKEIIPWVKLNLATIKFEQGKNKRSLEYLYDLLNTISENEKGSLLRCRNKAIILKEKILKKI